MFSKLTASIAFLGLLGISTGPIAAQTSPAPAAPASAAPAPAAPPASPGASAAPAVTSLPEDPAVTTAAKAFFAQLVAGKVDRSHLGAELNKALTDALQAKAAQQLGAAGTPTWTFLEQLATSQGNVSFYKLTFTGGTLFMTFGMTPKGIIDIAFLGSQPPPTQ